MIRSTSCLVVARDAEVDRLAAGRATSARSIGRLESRISPGASSTGPSRSSSPVDSTPTRARGTADTVAGAEAREHAEVRRRPAPSRRENTVTPASRSPPARRTWSPAVAACRDRARRRRRRGAVRSTMTIASAPSGIGAPVMIRIASPGADGHGRRLAGRQLGDDREPHRRVLRRAGGVGGPHRVPVHRGVRERRHRLPGDDRLGEHEAESVVERRRPRGERGDRGEDLGLDVGERDHAADRSQWLLVPEPAALGDVGEDLLELGAEVGPVERELDVRPQEVDLLADVVAAGLERRSRRPSASRGAGRWRR